MQSFKTLQMKNLCLAKSKVKIINIIDDVDACVLYTDDSSLRTSTSAEQRVATTRLVSLAGWTAR